jgi:two-component system NtrC family sensor kinase
VREKTEELKKAQTHIIMTEKMASLGKLSAAVAHEINNPIFGILSYAKLTQRYLDELKNNPELFEQVKENLRFIGEEAKRCGEIVRNLLIFAKKSTGEFKEEHLSELVKVAINLVEHGARMKKVDIVKELDSPDDLIYADANAIIQAFVAFLVNAIEAVAEGGVVKVGIASSDESIKVMIADNGRGISEDVLPHIFEPFFTTKENRKSIGMGLSIAYSIVDQHGGKIEVKSRVNEGTTFTVYLPRHMRDSHHL